MVSKVNPPARVASPATIRNQDRIGARLEARESLNYAHMQSVMKANRHGFRKAREQASQAPQEIADPEMALRDQTTSRPKHRRQAPPLHIETKPVSQILSNELTPCAVEKKRRPVSSVYDDNFPAVSSMDERVSVSLRSPYAEMNPYASKREDSRVSAPARKVSTDKGKGVPRIKDSIASWASRVSAPARKVSADRGKEGLRIQDSKASWATMSVDDAAERTNAGTTLGDIYDEYRKAKNYGSI